MGYEVEFPKSYTALNLDPKEIVSIRPEKIQD